MQVAGGVAVAGRFDLLRPTGAATLTSWASMEKAAGDVDVLLRLAQDRGELLAADVVGSQVVFDLLEGELAKPSEARTQSRRVREGPVTGWSPRWWRSARRGSTSRGARRCPGSRPR